MSLTDRNGSGFRLRNNDIAFASREANRMPLSNFVCPACLSSDPRLVLRDCQWHLRNVNFKMPYPHAPNQLQCDSLQGHIAIRLA